MESFFITWTALPKMVFPNTVMANISIGRIFIMIVGIFTKLDQQILLWEE